MIEQGWEDGKFYVQYTSPTRQFKSTREEYLRDAMDLYTKYEGRITLLISSGLDSQTLLRSFLDQNLFCNLAFIQTPYNEEEERNLCELESKWLIKVTRYKVDPINDFSDITDNLRLTNMHFRWFIDQIPSDQTVVLMSNDPWLIKENHLSVWHSYYDPSVIRHRVMEEVTRTGDIVDFPNNDCGTASILCDPLLQWYCDSLRYTDGNGLEVRSYKFYDTYIKPLALAREWKDDLIYFPKLTGMEQWPAELRVTKDDIPNNNKVIIPLTELIAHMNNCNGMIKRWYAIN